MIKIESHPVEELLLRINMKGHKNSGVYSHSHSHPFHLIGTCSLITRNMENLSLIEHLPRELLWRIFDYVPESVLELRSVSFFFASNATKDIKCLLNSRHLVIFAHC